MLPLRYSKDLILVFSILDEQKISHIGNYAYKHIVVKEPNFECIVASEETRAGCEKINTMRTEKGWLPLQVDLVPLVGGDTAADKTSSTDKRRETLGTLLRPPRREWLARDKPYIIGVTGGASCPRELNSSTLNLYPQ